MKPLVFLSFLIFINIKYSSAQEIKSNTHTDSTGTASSNIVSDYAFKIRHDEFNKGAIFSPLQLIQAKVPGFVINCLNDNDPNPALEIQLRGISTLILSTKPLYIIDGVPMETADIVPVENIESIEVLKNLSETAPYGIRGGNGVVIIKTKRYNSTPFTVNYNTYYYGETFAKKSSYMSPREWRKLKQDWATSPYSQLESRSATMVDYNADTDWRKEISQNKLSQAHHLGFFGGQKKTTYSALLNYNDYNGIIQKTGNTMYGGQFSVSQLALKDKLQVDVSIMSTLRKYSEINKSPLLNTTDPFTGLENSNILAYANRYNPTIPVYNHDVTYGIDSTSYLTYNPINRIHNATDNRELKNTLFLIQASYEITKGLKLSASLSKYKMATENSFSNDYRNIAKNQYSSKRRETNDQTDRLYSIKLGYNKSFDFHNLDITFNFSHQRNDVNYNYKDSLIQNGSQLISRNWKTQDGTRDITILSGLLKYNYKSKYYLSMGILKETSPFYMLDVSSQYFPSITASWSLKNEDFLTNIDWLNHLNIRVGHGTGQRKFDFVDIFGFESNVIVSPNIHGSNMQEFNTGIDFSLITNRLYVSADYYNRKTKDEIAISSSPPSSTFPQLIRNNMDINNKGLEFYIKAKPSLKVLKWTFDFNISVNKNKLLSDLMSNGENLNGQPVGNFYGAQFAGYSETNQLQVYDDQGNPAVYLYNYRKKLGNGAPKSFYGFSNTFEFKNWDLAISARGALGFEIANWAKLEEYKKTLHFVDQRDIVNRELLKTTDYFIEKGNYLKISNVSLGYTIPCKNHFINHFRIYAACNNVALFTKANDADPEKAMINGSNPGIFYIEKYPDTRIFLMGLK
jgi:TonB-linked SusC/RagA family outer membrane protein